MAQCVPRVCLEYEKSLASDTAVVRYADTEGKIDIERTDKEVKSLQKLTQAGTACASYQSELASMHAFCGQCDHACHNMLVLTQAEYESATAFDEDIRRLSVTGGQVMRCTRQRCGCCGRGVGRRRNCPGLHEVSIVVLCNHVCTSSEFNASILSILTRWQGERSQERLHHCQGAPHTEQLQAHSTVKHDDVFAHSSDDIAVGIRCNKIRTVGKRGYPKITKIHQMLARLSPASRGIHDNHGATDMQ
eukprot:4463547-Amphidinium_carterae.2